MTRNRNATVVLFFTVLVSYIILPALYLSNRNSKLLSLLQPQFASITRHRKRYLGDHRTTPNICLI